MIKNVVILFLVLFAGTVYSQLSSTLQEIRWERSDNRLAIRFVFDLPPMRYPAYFNESSNVLTIDFADSKLAGGAVSAGRAPYPLAGFSINEDVFEDSSKIVHTTVSLKQKLPYELKQETSGILLSIDLSPMYTKQVKLFSGTPDSASGNGLSAVSLQIAKDTVEILFTCLKAPDIYPVWLSPDKKRLVADLEGVAVSSDIAGFEKSEPVSGVTLQRSEDVSRWIVDFSSPVVAVSTEVQGNSISILAAVPLSKGFKFKPKKWMYWSAAGAAVLTTGVILLSGGSAKKAPASNGGNGNTGPDDWNDLPPNPDGQ